jgi:hypothetical protein
MADEELFDDLDEFGDLSETPDFDLGEEPLPDLGGPDDEGGVSRTFKIVGGIIALSVIVIVVLLVLFAFNSGNKLTSNEKTSTAVVKTNVAIEIQYNATLTALAMIEQATQTAVRNFELTGTAQEFLAQTQRAIDATNAAQTSTAEFIANQTLAAAQTATQAQVNQDMTATALANSLKGRVFGKDGTAFEGATLKLYRDNGDGIFTPADLTPVPGAETASAAGSAGGGATVAGSIAYGQTVQGTLSMGQKVAWAFTGSANDSVTIDAIASDPVQMDMFLELLGPNGNVLIGDDDSGDESNARISSYRLPASGQYTIRVSSVAGAGDYSVMLSLGLGVPQASESPAAPAGPGATETPGGSTGYLPGMQGKPLAVAVAQQSPTPEISRDELISVITTATNGTFDFGSLEPGVYWLELDYDSLPPDLKVLVPAGAPLVIKVTVPVQGEVNFEVGGAGPTPVPTSPPGLSAIDMTATEVARRTGAPVLVTLTATSEVTGTITPGATMPGTGFFSDIGSGGSGTGGLTVLGIAAAGLVAVLFIARRLRTSV